MANEKNLKPPRSTEEARERGKKGGIASGEARREKKSLKNAVLAILEGKAEGNLTGYEVAATQLFKALYDSDKVTSAFNSMRDLIGEKPKDEVEIEDKRVSSIVVEFTDGNENDQEDTILGAGDIPNGTTD